MRLLPAALALSAASVSSAATTTAAAGGETHAVLVASSSGFSNYRHQADICHALQVLLAGGVKRANIVTMFYDDIASFPENPYPGKIFNRPTEKGTAGADVYDGCVADYSGKDVSAATFLKVLNGDKSAGGPVLTSGPNDRVFVNIVDHGAPGFVAFPSDELHAADLVQTLSDMHDAQKFENLAFYLEACESGSIFPDLPTNISVYATTAANSSQSSWGTYCPPNDVVDGVEMNTCLGDLYSVSWMEDSDAGHPGSYTLHQQFKATKLATNKSEVCEFGSTNMKKEAIADFQSDGASPAAAARGAAPVAGGADVKPADAELVMRFYKYLRNPGEGDAAALVAEVERRERVQSVFDRVVSLADQHAALELGDAAAVRALALPEPNASEWRCNRRVGEAYKESCLGGGGWDATSLHHARVLLHLCQLGLGDAAVEAAVRGAC